MALSFAIDTSKGETFDSAKGKRRQADMLAQSILGRAPKNVGEGLNSIGQALIYRMLMNESGAAERAGEASASDTMGSIFGGFPAAPAAGGAGPVASADPSVSPNANVGSTIDFARAKPAPVDLSGDQQTFISTLLPAAIEESKRTGVDPRIIVAQAAQETGWGKSAPGNNYFGIKSHGKEGGQNLTTHEVVNGQRVKVNDSFRQFGSPAESVRGYGDFLLENPRYKPMMAAQGLDAQLQALGASGYATDPNYAASVGSIARGIPMPAQQPAPAQVASLDPSIGMPAAGPVPSEYSSMGLTPEAWAGMNAPDGGQPAPQPAPAQPAPRMVPDMPIAATQPPWQTAQAAPSPQDLSTLPVTAGGTAGALQPGQSSGPSLQQLLQAAQNPWLNDNQRQVVNMLLEQEMQKQDPMRQLQMQKLQKEISGSDAGEFKVVGDQLVRIAPGGVISDVTPANAQGAATGAFRFGGKSVEAQALNGLMDSGQLTPEQAQQLGAGKTITGPNGEIIFMTPQGVFGQPAGGGAPQPLGGTPPPQQQGNIPITSPKITADEKKAMTFADRMATSGKIIDEMGMSGSGKVDRTVSGVPFIGEYLTSDDFKKVDAAKRDFINAQLRRESGAVIADSEFANAELQYFPQPNDPPEVVEQKKQLRKRVIDGMQRDAGPTYQDPTAEEWIEMSPGVRIRKVK